MLLKESGAPKNLLTTLRTMNKLQFSGFFRGNHDCLKWHHGALSTWGGLRQHTEEAWFSHLGELIYISLSITVIIGIDIYIFCIAWTNMQMLCKLVVFWGDLCVIFSSFWLGHATLCNTALLLSLSQPSFLTLHFYPGA